MKICLKMTGCKNNRYELDQILSWAIKNGVSVVREEDADYCVINTCTVTHVADKKSRQLIRKTKKQTPKAKNIVFGCGARAQKDDFSRIMEIDFLLTDMQSVIDFLESQIDKSVVCNNAQLRVDINNRSRALTQVQDGCDNYCAYCIIASARGASNNRKTDDILDEINNHVINGYSEVVLTGINVGAFGCTSTRKPKETKFAELLETIIDKTEIPLIRISSLGPEYFNEHLHRVLQNPRICRHIHLSIQSGCTSVLEKMKRQYNADDVEKVIQRLKKDIPSIAITTDIIVGFPEETDEEFEKTMEFVKRNPLAKAHVFPYSIRKNTIAAKMKQVDDDIKKKRAKKLQTLADKQRKEFISEQIGKEITILWENDGEGLTDNYIRVKSVKKREPMSVSKEVLREDMVGERGSE